MANRAEQRISPRDLSGARRIDFPPTAEPSVPAALEKIASVSQRVLSKRIDLLMLDNHEMISRLLVKAALLSVGVFAGLAAWMTALAALVTWLVPSWSSPGQLAIFAFLNAIGAAAVVYFTLRKPPQLSGETEEQLEDEAESIEAAEVASTNRDHLREAERTESVARRQV